MAFLYILAMDELTDKIQLAWNMASAAHKSQFYTNNDGLELPYLNHIGAVVNEVYAVLADNPEVYNAELVLLCAILHDTVEDTALTLTDIETAFGTPVANGVWALTKNSTMADKQEKMAHSITRILQQPREIAMVKMADRIVNLQPPPKHWPAQKANSYHAEAVFIYEALHSLCPTLGQRLLKKIENYSQYF
jgi:(p)ppGpp synthase/HD superfamily hydrolase